MSNTTNLTGSRFQDYVPDDAVCCLISVSGSRETDGFSFVEVSKYEMQGHYQPRRWQWVLWALQGKRHTFLEFYNGHTLDRFIASLQEARKAILT